MLTGKNKPLILGSFFVALAAFAHVGCIVFGASWYRFFGAGEQMAVMAEQGLWYPTIVTSFIVVVLASWSLYGLAGAQVIRRLPFTRLALMLISSIFILRGISFPWLMPMFPDNSQSFWYVSSSICLAIGLLYALGLYQSWGQLSKRST